MTRSKEVNRGSERAPRSATVPIDSPRAIDEPVDPAPSAPQSTSLRGRVLVIDDEPAGGRVMMRTLERQHDTVVVTSGREALDRIAAGERFDVLLCDVRMPHMSGIEVHARLLPLASDQAKRMIFMTGDGLPGAEWAMLDRLRLPILEKPFPIQLLRLLVQTRLGRE